MYTIRGFMKAVSRDDVETVARYLARRDAGEWLVAKNSDGDTALHVAAREGSDRAIELLLKHGAAFTATNQQSYTPMALAVQSNRHTVVKRFLDAGADINQVVPGNITMLTLAALRADTAMIDLLIAAKADINKGQPLQQALYYGHESIALQLLNAGANMEEEGRNGQRPLHYAASQGHNQLLKLLIEKNADVNAQDQDGNTPLHHAISRGNIGAVDALLKKGARTDIENHQGATAVQLAAERGNKQIRRLIEPVAQEALAKSTTALTASATALPEQDAEVWVPMGRHQMARVGVYPALSRRLTEIFNFETRERLIITENLKTGAENVTPPLCFDETDERALRAAFNAFRAAGGDIDEGTVFGAAKTKPSLKAM